MRAGEWSILGIFVAVLTATLAAVYQSFVSNVFFADIVPWFAANVRPVDILIIVLSILTICGVVVIIFRQNKREKLLSHELKESVLAKQALEHSAQRANSALRRLSSAYADILEQQHLGKKDLETSLQDLCRSAIGSICDYYDGRVLRGSVLVVSIEHPNFLVWHSGFGFEEAERAAKRFYIGSEHDPHYHGEKRGIAGEAWINRSTIVTHIDRATKTADNPGEFIDFERDRATYAFASFVCLLLKAPHEPAPCGMLCLDSVERETFDADPECTPVQPLIDFLTQLLDMRQRLLVSTREITRDPIVWE